MVKDVVFIDDVWQAFLDCDKHPDCEGCKLHKPTDQDIGLDICFAFGQVALKLARKGLVTFYGGGRINK